MSTMRPPLTTSMTGPSTTPSSSLSFSIVPHARSYWARFLDSSEAALLVLLLEDEGLDLLAERDDLVRVDVVADAQLTRRDDALALVADVEQHLVLVDLDDRAVDELAVLDLDHRAVDGVGEGHAEVVDDDLAGGVVALLVERAQPGGGRTVAVEEVAVVSDKERAAFERTGLCSRMPATGWTGPDAGYEGSSEPWSIAMGDAHRRGRSPGTPATRCVGGSSP